MSINMYLYIYLCTCIRKKYYTCIMTRVASLHQRYEDLWHVHKFDYILFYHVVTNKLSTIFLRTIWLLKICPSSPIWGMTFPKNFSSPLFMTNMTPNSLFQPPLLLNHGVTHIGQHSALQFLLPRLHLLIHRPLSDLYKAFQHP
jgi:hypothetical protein